MAKKITAKTIKKKSLMEALTGTKNTLEALTNCATNDVWDGPPVQLSKVPALGNTDIEGVRWDEIEQLVLTSGGDTILVNSSGTVSRGNNKYINLDEAVSFEEEPHSKNMNKIKDYMFKTPGGSTKPCFDAEEVIPTKTVEWKTQTRPWSPPKEEMSIKKEMKVEQIAYALFRDGVNLEGKYYVAIGPIFLNPVDKKEYRLSKVEGIDDLVSIEVPKYELMTTKKEKV